MKRSEMLNLMLESYCKDIPYHDDGGLQLQWKITRLLDDMENAGMLPPMLPIPEHAFQANHEWEPEDET